MHRITIIAFFLTIALYQVCQCGWKEIIEEKFNHDLENRIKAHKSTLRNKRKDQKTSKEIARKCQETQQSYSKLVADYKIKVNHCAFKNDIGSVVMKCLEDNNATALIQEQAIFDKGLKCVTE